MQARVMLPLNSYLSQLLKLSLIFYPRSNPVKNGDVIRLQHHQTKVNLHSHYHASPLSKQQVRDCGLLPSRVLFILFIFVFVSFSS